VQLHALFDDCRISVFVGAMGVMLQTIEWVHQRIAGDGGCGTTGSCRGLARLPEW
jgi:hypothetical protein